MYLALVPSHNVPGAKVIAGGLLFPTVDAAKDYCPSAEVLYCPLLTEEEMDEAGVEPPEAPAPDVIALPGGPYTIKTGADVTPAERVVAIPDASGSVVIAPPS